MSAFVIDKDNRITAFALGEAVPETGQPATIKTIDDLTAVTEGWPPARLVAVWNTLPGTTPVKKFTDRNTAIARIWKAIHGLAPQTVDTTTNPAATEPETEPILEAGAATDAA